MGVAVDDILVLLSRFQSCAYKSRRLLAHVPPYLGNGSRHRKVTHTHGKRKGRRTNRAIVRPCSANGSGETARRAKTDVGAWVRFLGCSSGRLAHVSPYLGNDSRHRKDTHTYGKRKGRRTNRAIVCPCSANGTGEIARPAKIDLGA